VTETLKSLLDAHRPGYSLPGGLYRDPEIYEQEIRAIFMKSWLCVGHGSQIPESGDYFLFEMAGESVIIVRDAEGDVHALMNVCRHRGSRVCEQLTGHAARLTCPYHGWTYGLDGSLRAAAHMREGFDRGKHGLQRLHVHVLDGLIFINFADNPISFEPIKNDLSGPIAPYQLSRARVAHRQNYPIAANWKLAVENYCECYHCVPAHPEYSVAHSRAVPYAKQAELLAEVIPQSEAAGFTSMHYLRASWLDAGGLGIDRGFKRYALMRGHKTGSRDGEPLAPLLGSIKCFDGSAVDLHLGPMMFGLAYSDHVVLYRFTPRGLRATDCELTWLVSGSASANSDYNLAELTWLWDVTTIADKRIIEQNQAGVDSRFYRPGPLSSFEEFSGLFLQWYLTAMRAASGAS
jgi:phenylpropionate dioxygenase-like ring-hydroxylating dioxygenase large terminal subunit